jgi:phosphonate transport system substrate-binding protein
MMRDFIHLGLCLLAFVATTARAELRFGIEPRGSAEETRAAFTRLADYLSRELNEPVRLVIADDFTDYGRKLQNREFDITFAAPATILYSMELKGPELAAVALDRDSGATLKGVFLVPKDSPIESLAQLKGKKIAYVAKSSQGYIVQSHTLRQAGLDPAKDVEAQFTQKLDRAVAAVLDGKADAAGVGDVVFGKLKGKMDLSSLRLLSTSPATPNWVVVSLHAGKTTTLKRALLKLAPGSAPAKSVMGEKNFVGFQDIDVAELDLLKTAVRAAKDSNRPQRTPAGASRRAGTLVAASVAPGYATEKNGRPLVCHVRLL